MHVVASNGLFLHSINFANKCPYKFSCEQPLLFHFLRYFIYYNRVNMDTGTFMYNRHLGQKYINPAPINHKLGQTCMQNKNLHLLHFHRSCTPPVDIYSYTLLCKCLSIPVKKKETIS